MSPSALDVALSDVSCRIFTISSSLTQALSFIQRVRKLGDVQSPEGLDAESLVPAGPPNTLIKVPWTISNKYYSADVHFAAHTIHGLSSHQLQNVPAVIFVWVQGEPYRHDVERVAQDLAGYKPEVCLAVRDWGNSRESEDEDEDDSDIDSFLSSHGFEYVDATAEQSSNDVRESDHYSDIPHLPRVLDALSTIMWPSMQPKTKGIKQPRSAMGRGGQEFLDWAQSSRDRGSSVVDEKLTSSSRVQEMRDLARWLEEDESLSGGDPWRTAASSGAISVSPTTMEFEKETQSACSQNAALGFDDDFTVFISAPAIKPSDNDSGHRTPDMPVGSLSASLLPPDANDLYRPLGSGSDCGSDEGGHEHRVEEEEDLPTQEEIRATSSRIFGAAQPTAPMVKTGTSCGSKSDETSVVINSFSTHLEHSDVDEEVGSYDMARFDLSRVVSTLQEMKAEIAKMDDEGERRKAAARVALGLVYGLEAEP